MITGQVRQIHLARRIRASPRSSGRWKNWRWRGLGRWRWAASPNFRAAGRAVVWYRPPSSSFLRDRCSRLAVLISDQSAPRLVGRGADSFGQGQTLAGARRRRRQAGPGPRHPPHEPILTSQPGRRRIPAENPAPSRPRRQMVIRNLTSRPRACGQISVNRARLQKSPRSRQWLVHSLTHARTQ